MSFKGSRAICLKGYPRTRRYTRISREVFAGWIRRVGSIDRNIPPENVPALLSDMHIYSSPAPVGEMLQCAKEAAPRGPHIHYPSPVKKTHDRATSRQLSKNGDDKSRRPRKMSKFYVKHDVFLGGSCNPTTWRHDVAIPFFESRGISFFNPQVAEWSPDLVEVEHNAKEKASVLLYVLDRRTRNVVGILEAAYFAGSKRNLVLVLDTYRKQELVAGETISQNEYEELLCGQATLKDLVQHCGYVVFDRIHEAIDWTAKVLEGKPRGRCNATIRNSMNNEENRLQLLRETFDAIDANKRGEIDLSDVYMAYQILSKKKSVEDLRKIISPEKRSNPEHMKIDFEKFCSMMIQLKEDSESVQRNHNERIKRCCSRNLRVDNGSAIDIYVGGSCYDVEWKRDIAVPMLKKSGLKYQLNDCRKVQCSRACSKELQVMDKSKVLVFIITGNTRGLESMALASYYIGKGKQVVLCIQEVTETSTVFDENLSKLARNDYNRGRVYLKDLAKRCGVTVTDNVPDAIQAAVEKSAARAAR
uniref:Caltractin n=1 Tax=Lygus hesperus TaxID=30085 RepID=A0A0A9Z8Y7_LYGHE